MVYHMTAVLQFVPADQMRFQDFMGGRPNDLNLIIADPDSGVTFLSFIDNMSDHLGKEAWSCPNMKFLFDEIVLDRRALQNG